MGSQRKLFKKMKTVVELDKIPNIYSKVLKLFYNGYLS